VAGAARDVRGREAAEIELYYEDGWEEAARGDVSAWFTSQWRENTGDGAQELAPYGGRFPGLAERGGERRDDASAAAIDSLENVSGLALVPVTRPADALGAIGFSGAVNYDYAPGDLSAVLRSWEQRFDAILVGVGLDTAFVAVRRPPAGQVALRVAAEHFVFAPDSVWQGTGSLRKLAGEVRGSRAWAFWWD
jgi:Domain of unknown function (DUF4253)